MSLSRTVTRLLPAKTVIALRSLKRRLTGIPQVGTVNLGDLRRLTPISRAFGFDRGTPIDRFYIERFLDANSSDIRGRVLEIGEDTYSRRYGGNRIGSVDILNLTADCPEATIIADLSNAPHVADDQFDTIIFTQTLQYVRDAPAAIRTLYRILAPRGVLLMTVPGISRAEAGPNSPDTKYWSFTDLSVRALLNLSFKPSDVVTTVGGNVLAAVAFLEGLALEEVGKDALEYQDPDYPVNIAARAMKDGMPS